MAIPGRRPGPRHGWPPPRSCSRLLDAVAHLGQRWRHGRLAEFTDVGAGDEGLAFAHDQHRLHGGIGLRLFHCRQQTGAHGLAQGIDRRIVDADHQHRTFTAGLDGGDEDFSVHGTEVSNIFDNRSRHSFPDKASLQSPELLTDRQRLFDNHP
jgi:hypothetical protein